MDKSGQSRFDNEEVDEVEKPYYQDRRGSWEAGRKKKRWWIPLTLLMIIVAVVGSLWYIGSRTQFWLFQDLMEAIFPAEEEIQIIMPAALFAGQDFEEIAACAVEEQGVDEIVPIEEDQLVYNMTPEVREKLLTDAENDLEEKLSTLEDGRQHPYVVEISYDDSFEEFYLMIEPDQFDQALVPASELYAAAVYYQYLIAAGDEAREVAVELENEETGARETLAYPGDLNRVASILERPAVADEEPVGPAAGDEVVVDTGPDNLNLRDGPAITYLIIDILSSGTVLEVIDEEGEWLKVITPDQKEGWVHGDFVELVDKDS